MKELLNLCTKSVHFTFDGNIDVQNNGVAMDVPLGSVRIGTIGNANSNGQDEELGKIC